MSNGVLSGSNLARGEKLAKNYRMIVNILRENENIKNNIKNELFNIMHIEEVTKISKVKLVSTKKLESMEMKDIAMCFNDDSLLDFLVVTVDIESTKQNLKLKLNKNDDFVNKVLALLEKKAKITIPELEVIP